MMVFKLIRTDAVDPCKIQLPVGTHIFGRNVFLDCDDKRVSRSHGELQVAVDMVTLKALHQNPCFYMRKGTEEKEILRQESTICLCHGDRFGLLPDKFWYELLHYTVTPDVEISNNVGNEKEIETRDSDKENYDSKSQRTILNTENVSSNDKNKDFDDSDSELLNIDMNESVMNDTDTRPSSPSVILNQPVTDTKEPEPSCSTETLSPKKRSHSPTEEAQERTDEVKKVKTEPEDTHEDANPSTSSSTVKTEPKSPVKDEPQSPAKPANNVALRERCIYGAQCYRKNPQHKAQFSHPNDADWGTDEKGVCPWGANCRRRDARHWRDHTHPPGVQQSNAQGPPRVVERHGNIFYINAHTVNFYDDHFQVEDSDGDSVDYDYEF